MDIASGRRLAVHTELEAAEVLDVQNRRRSVGVQNPGFWGSESHAGRPEPPGSGFPTSGVLDSDIPPLSATGIVVRRAASGPGNVLRHRHHVGTTVVVLQCGSSNGTVVCWMSCQCTGTARASTRTGTVLPHRYGTARSTVRWPQAQRRQLAGAGDSGHGSPRELQQEHSRVLEGGCACRARAPEDIRVPRPPTSTSICVDPARRVFQTLAVAGALWRAKRDTSH